MGQTPSASKSAKPGQPSPKSPAYGSKSQSPAIHPLRIFGIDEVLSEPLPDFDGKRADPLSEAIYEEFKTRGFLILSVSTPKPKDEQHSASVNCSEVSALQNVRKEGGDEHVNEASSSSGVEMKSTSAVESQSSSPTSSRFDSLLRLREDAIEFFETTSEEDKAEVMPEFKGENRGYVRVQRIREYLKLRYEEVPPEPETPSVATTASSSSPGVSEDSQASSSSSTASASTSVTSEGSEGSRPSSEPTTNPAPVAIAASVLSTAAIRPTFAVNFRPSFEGLFRTVWTTYLRLYHTSRCKFYQDDTDDAQTSSKTDKSQTQGTKGAREEQEGRMDLPKGKRYLLNSAELDEVRQCVWERSYVSIIHYFRRDRSEDRAIASEEGDGMATEEGKELAAIGDQEEKRCVCATHTDTGN
jgi:hypothetical protein